MCYLMALSKQDVFRAVAPISGLMLVWMYRELEAPKPIPVFELHGSEDTTSLMEGDLTNEGGWGEYMPVHQAVNYFVAKNRCLQEKRDTIPGKTHDNICRNRNAGNFITDSLQQRCESLRIIRAVHIF